MVKLFVNARFLTQPISGVQRYGIECSTQIKKICNEVIFLAPGNIIDENLAKELNVQVIGDSTGQGWEQYDLPKYLKKNGYPPLLNLANTAPLYYRNNFITIHDLAFRRHPEWNSRLFSGWYNFLLPKLAKRAKHIFTVSEVMRQEIMQYYQVPADKLSVTGNGISAKMLLRDRMVCAVKEKVILSVGSFNVRKNHHKLIRGFLASGLQDKYRLVIMGDKSKVFKETGLDEPGMQHSNITVLQGLTDNELIDWYCRAEIIASLSLYEGFGIPMLEGLYMGCKAVCSDIPVYKDLYGNFARFCDPNDVAGIGQALRKATESDRPAEAEIAQLIEKHNYMRCATLILQQIEAHTT